MDEQDNGEGEVSTYLDMRMDMDAWCTRGQEALQAYEAIVRANTSMNVPDHKETLRTHLALFDGTWEDRQGRRPPILIPLRDMPTTIVNDLFLSLAEHYKIVIEECDRNVKAAADKIVAYHNTRQTTVDDLGSLANYEAKNLQTGSS